MTSIWIAAVLGVLMLLTPRLCAGFERINAAIEDAMRLVALVVTLASLIQRGPNCGPPLFWKDVARLQKALAARSAFVGSPALVGLALLQLLLTIVIFQGSSADVGSIALIVHVVLSALTLVLVIGLYQVATDLLARTPACGVPPVLFLRHPMNLHANWLRSVPRPPPRNS